MRMTIWITLSLFVIITLGIYLLQNKLIFFPEVLLPNYKYEFNGEFEEVDFSISEGVKINALHFKAKDSKGIVFYSHGNAGSLRTWGLVSDVFTRLNYDLLIYDYRGYGKSDGNITEKLLYQDANMIYEKLMESYPEDKIIVYGRSIGTGVAAHVALNHSPQHLILESPYYNLPDLAKNIFPFMPSFLIRYGLKNNEMILHISSPITIFHGTIDEIIYFGSSMKLEKLFKEEDRLVAVSGGHHNDLANFEIYHEELASILK